MDDREKIAEISKVLEEYCMFPHAAALKLVELGYTRPAEPAEDRVDKETIPDFNLPWQLHPYADKGYDTCPDCGHDRNSPAGTVCRMGSHYGTYSTE